MPVVIVQDEAIFVLLGITSFNGRMLQRFRHFVVGKNHPEGTLVAEKITGTPLEQVAQLTLEQGEVISRIQKGLM